LRIAEGRIILGNVLLSVQSDYFAFHLLFECIQAHKFIILPVAYLVLKRDLAYWQNCSRRGVFENRDLLDVISGAKMDEITWRTLQKFLGWTYTNIEESRFRVLGCYQI